MQEGKKMSTKEKKEKSENNKKATAKINSKKSTDSEKPKGPFVVFEMGSEQCLVREGDIISIEKFSNETSGKVKIENILLYGNGDDIQIGQPFLEGISVDAELLSVEKDSKVLGMKFKKKTGYKKVFGHRQTLSTLKINKIALKSLKNTKKETA